MKLPFSRIKNSKGSIFYGMHFYPGVAEYQEPDKAAFRVFLNEDTIRRMDPTFAGRPVFVLHVDDVAESVDELRKEADGWVIESFFNAADGKHWTKFIAVSERAERAIRNGMKLSNCYRATNLGPGGTWNGVQYAKEITGGEYEHLAIVPNPRYEESVILTPEEFKAYNENKIQELKRLANNKEDGTPMKVKLNLFRRAKVENSADLEGVLVALPKSGREVSIETLVNEADELAVAMGAPKVATDDMLVTVGESQMSIADLVSKYSALVAAQAAPAAVENEETDDGADVEGGDELENEDDDSDDQGDDDAVENEDDAVDDELAAAKKKNAAPAPAAAAPKAGATVVDPVAAKAAKAKAEALRNANSRPTLETARVDLDVDRVARGKARYGS